MGVLGSNDLFHRREEQLEELSWDGAFSALSHIFLSLRTSSRKTVKPEPGAPKAPLLQEHSLAYDYAADFGDRGWERMRKEDRGCPPPT